MTEAPIFLAASTILVREQDDLEVLMVKRHHKIDFVAGAMVFPGGKLNDDDADPAWADHVIGWAQIPEAERAPRIAAIRECFEECGIILGDPGRIAPGPETLALRKAVDRREVRFIDAVRANGVVLDLSRLTLFSRWLTPAVVPKRFDTFFYLAAAPARQDALSDGRETVEAEWIAPAHALELARAREREIVFPTRMNLGLLAQTETLDAAFEAARSRAPRTVLPSIITRGGDRYLQLAVDDGYGAVEELLELP
ncbi:MAG: NUDIX domain-containing protein [Pseudomonadota bacterium]|nr:NUDIX domain-containing protein [Pseudomonadota bacterium]